MFRQSTAVVAITGTAISAAGCNVEEVADVLVDAVANLVVCLVDHLLLLRRGQASPDRQQAQSDELDNLRVKNSMSQFIEASLIITSATKKDKMHMYRHEYVAL